MSLPFVLCHPQRGSIVIVLLGGLLASTVLGGCAGRGDGTASASLTITLRLSPTKAAPAQDYLLVTITDSSGHPLDGATVQVRGDMTMAGMPPVIVTATGTGHGHYTAGPLTLGMAGDWVFSVSGKLGDSRSLSHQFAPVHVTAS